MRYLLPILGLLVVVGGLAGIKFAQISSLVKAGEAFAKAGPPPETVSTDVSRELSWEGSLSAVGSVAAERAVAISTEVPGVVKKILFDSGNMAKPGQILVELDTSVEQAQLATAQAKRLLAAQTLARTRALSEGKAVPRAQIDTDEAQLKSTEADVAALQAQIARKIIRAPFAGKLGIRAVNLGQYLSPGTAVTSLDALDSVFVDFTLPQQALASLRHGQSVRMTVDVSLGDGAARSDADTNLAVEGTITAIDPSLDSATRAIRVRASVPNVLLAGGTARFDREQKLRPGMFANVSVVLPGRTSVVAVPMTAVVHAPYGDSVFLVEPLEQVPPGAPPGMKQVRQQFVRLGEERGDFVAVVEGIDSGREVVSAGAFKLRNGGRNVVNNKVKPTPEINPRPSNR